MIQLLQILIAFVYQCAVKNDQHPTFKKNRIRIQPSNTKSKKNISNEICSDQFVLLYKVSEMGIQKIVLYICPSRFFSSSIFSFERKKMCTVLTQKPIFDIKFGGAYLTQNLPNLECLEYVSLQGSNERGRMRSSRC